MTKKDYYDTLGINKDASKDEVKKAYKKLAMKYHPDRAPEEKKKEYEEKFKVINEAASVLGDEQKRAQYDQFGTAEPGFDSSSFNGFDFSNFSTSDGDFDFEDIFDTFFGGGRGRSRRGGARKGSDLLYNLEISLEEAAFGAQKTLSIPRYETCHKCDGSGAKSHNSVKACETCHGTGMFRRTQRTPFGIFQSSSPCNKCHGTGKVITEYCEECEGEGRVRKTRNLDISIPKGALDGTRLRVSDEGEAGERGAPSGDLYVQIKVKKHPIFEREENDIYLEIPISFKQACLGDEVDVPTLRGRISMKIPSGTPSNTVFRIRGKGIPHLRGFSTGDEFVKVVVETPTKLTKRQKELLTEFDELSEEQPFANFVDKLKGLFE